MITIGNFFFKYRNWLFIALYLLLFLPSPPIFKKDIWPITVGLPITIAGQLLRGLTIGLAYIIRGGKDGKAYAEDLVTTGIFNHCRNPLYLGNILMLLGVGILANSLLYLIIVIPAFIFIYQAIVLAEENFLRNKFGDRFNMYCRKVNRWMPSFKNISETLRSMKFHWKRWLIKEYNTQFIWLTGIVLILLYKYPELTDTNKQDKTVLFTFIFPLLVAFYFSIRYLKKSGYWRDV